MSMKARRVSPRPRQLCLLLVSRGTDIINMDLAAYHACGTMWHHMVTCSCQFVCVHIGIPFCVQVESVPIAAVSEFGYCRDDNAMVIHAIRSSDLSCKVLASTLTWAMQRIASMRSAVTLPHVPTLAIFIKLCLDMHPYHTHHLVRVAASKAKYIQVNSSG